jgi:tetratricopeptide (TPR) repeat protein
MLTGESRDAFAASAALVDDHAVDKATSDAPFVVGDSAAVRFANLELSPPGCDARRRATALVELDASLGEDAKLDALALAGWSALAAGELPAARAAWAKVTVARPDDLASWEGLRTCAEIQGDRALRANAAAELGSRCADASRGAAFSEEAALLFLEIGDEGRGEASLDAAFARDATRGVAFDRLFRRVRERKDGDRLLALIARRLDVTDEPKEIAKLFWEQARVLREKGDQEGALKALEHTTMLEPDHVGALALTGEIALKRGLFDEAATALARLASLDAAPAKNRITAGVAAVDIYENKLDRFDKALEVLLALHQAKLSTLPVRERLARAAARTGSWKEATSILEELMNERVEGEGRIEAARLAMAIHRDRLNDPEGARAAIVKLLQEAPSDGEALDMLLATEHPAEVRTRLLKAARAEILDKVAARPLDVTSVRRLAKVARALGDEGFQQAALTICAVVAPRDPQLEQQLAQLAAKKSRTPQTAVSQTLFKSLLAPGDEGPIADLFGALGPTLAEALGPSLQACGVGKRDKVDPRSGIALRNEIASWAGAFGVTEFDLYVGGKDDQAVQGIPGEVPAIVVGASVNAPLSATARARVAREILAIVRGTTVARTRDDVTVAAIVVAACHLAEVRVDSPAYAVLAEVEKLVSKAIPRKTKKLLPDLCRAVVASGVDARAWSKRAILSQARVALVASGDAVIVLSDLLGVAEDKLPTAAKTDPRAEELARFVLSPTYLEIRRSLGLEGSS